MGREFDLIARFFKRPPGGRGDVALGVGDDAAILRVPPGQDLLVSIDTLVSGTHFFPDVDAAALGHKALAVNLSDLAAMGADPAWATLALTLPAPDEDWLARFCTGFDALAREFGVALVGGDTTRGPLSVTVQVHGFAPPGAAFRRDAARAGDLVYVTGTLGDAGLALLLAGGGGAARCAPAHRAFLRERLERPSPRVREALRLRGLVHAAIDLSDGLYADLGHVLAASGVGATLSLADLPLSPAFRACAGAPGVAEALSAGDAPGPGGGEQFLPWAELALAAGDDYELCLTAAPERRAQVESALDDAGCAWARVGAIEARTGLRCVLADGAPYTPRRAGYDQFGDRAP